MAITVSLNCASTRNNRDIPDYEIPVTGTDTCDGSYREAIAAVQNRPIEEVSINEIARLRCLKYRSESSGDSLLRSEYEKAVSDSNHENILIYGKELLAYDFANPRLHDAVAGAAKALGREEEINYHAQYIVKHFQSFTVLGNGRSFESPLQAFAIGEEYEWLSLMGYGRGVQSLVVRNGRHFDVHTCKNRDGFKAKIFFDITGYWYYFHKMFMDTTNTKKRIILY